MKIVLCHGVFDLFHLGHLRHFKEARTYGDALYVSITADAYVHKGDGRPVYSTEQRREILMHCDLVDAVLISEFDRPDEIIKRVRPAFYAKGIEYKGKLPEEKLVQECGGKVVYTYDEVGSRFKTTGLLKHVKRG